MLHLCVFSHSASILPPTALSNFTPKLKGHQQPSHPTRSAHANTAQFLVYKLAALSRELQHQSGCASWARKASQDSLSWEIWQDIKFTNPELSGLTLNSQADNTDRAGLHAKLTLSRTQLPIPLLLSVSVSQKCWMQEGQGLTHLLLSHCICILRTAVCLFIPCLSPSPTPWLFGYILKQSSYCLLSFWWESPMTL